MGFICWWKLQHVFWEGEASYWQMLVLQVGYWNDFVVERKVEAWKGVSIIREPSVMLVWHLNINNLLMKTRTLWHCEEEAIVRFKLGWWNTLWKSMQCLRYLVSNRCVFSKKHMQVRLCECLQVCAHEQGSMYHNATDFIHNIHEIMPSKHPLPEKKMKLSYH